MADAITKLDMQGLKEKRRQIFGDQSEKEFCAEGNRNQKHKKNVDKYFSDINKELNMYTLFLQTKGAVFQCKMLRKLLVTYCC